MYKYRKKCLFTYCPLMFEDYSHLALICWNFYFGFMPVPAFFVMLLYFWVQGINKNGAVFIDWDINCRAVSVVAIYRVFVLGVT